MRTKLISFKHASCLLTWSALNQILVGYKSHLASKESSLSKSLTEAETYSPCCVYVGGEQLRCGLRLAQELWLCPGLQPKTEKQKDLKPSSPSLRGSGGGLTGMSGPSLWPVGLPDHQTTQLVLNGHSANLKLQARRSRVSKNRALFVNNSAKILSPAVSWDSCRKCWC